MNKLFYIYKIKISGYTYFGKAVNVDGRINRHLEDLKNNIHHNIVMQRIFNKHNEELTYEILYENLLNEEANLIEKELIQNNECINIAKGGDGGDTLSNHPNRDEIARKISKNHCRNFSAEWKNSQGKISERAEIVWGTYKCVKCLKDIKGKGNFLRYHGENGEKCGVPRPKIICPHCGKIGSHPGSMANRHFNKCKFKKD